MPSRVTVTPHGTHVQSSGIVVNVSPAKVVIEPSPADPPWIHYGVPFAAFVAAAFAVLTFVRMQRQIDLALKQIGLAERQIAQQDKSMEMALKDLEITTRQAHLADDDRAKVPNLQVQIQLIPSRDKVDDKGRVSVFLQVYVANYGRAAANNVYVQLQMPADVVIQVQEDVMALADVGAPRDDVRRTIELSPVVDSFGNRSAIVFNRGIEILPYQEPVRIGEGWFYIQPGVLKVLWRVKCRQGDFPAGNTDTVLDIVFS